MSKSTFRGTIVFVLLLIFIFILPDLISYEDSNDKAHWKIYSVEEKQLKTTLKHNFQRSQYRHVRKKKKHYSSPPAKFDPNNYQINDWMKLGLSEKQATVILKFSKYGIKSNEQLRKIFVIPDELYQLMKDSTYYPQKQKGFKPDQKTEIKEPVKKKLVIDLNSASEDQLKELPGIGDFFARNILKRREELGGFHTKEQLLEIWKFDQEKLNMILPYILMNPEGLHKIDLNTVNAKELKDHPYISWNLANSIVKLRLQNGKFTHIEDIKKSVLMTDELFEKLKPYLHTTP